MAMKEQIPTGDIRQKYLMAGRGCVNHKGYIGRQAQVQEQALEWPFWEVQIKSKRERRRQTREVKFEEQVPCWHKISHEETLAASSVLYLETSTKQEGDRMRYLEGALGFYIPYDGLSLSQPHGSTSPLSLIWSRPRIASPVIISEML
jgi:hypothetical protein